MKDTYVLPDGTVTFDAVLAAEYWAKAFYQAKDAIRMLRPSIDRILLGKPVRNLDEILLVCDSILNIGEK